MAKSRNPFMDDPITNADIQTVSDRLAIIESNLVEFVSSHRVCKEIPEILDLVNEIEAAISKTHAALLSHVTKSFKHQMED